MPRIDVPFVVDNQIIKQTPVVELTAGGKNYFYATFTFNELWDDIENPKASFSRLNETPYIMPLTPIDSGYECEIPWEVMRTNGMFSVGVFGGDRLNTDVVFVKVICGCEEAGEEPKPPTPDWFATMEKRIEEAEETTAKDVEALGDEVRKNAASVEELAAGVDDNTQDIAALESKVADVSNEIKPTETYDFLNCYYDEYNNFLRTSMPMGTQIGDTFVFFIPKGWKIEFRFSPNYEPQPPISATDKDIEYSLIFDGSFKDFWVDAFLDGNKPFNPKECPVTFKRERDRIGNIEEDVLELKNPISSFVNGFEVFDEGSATSQGEAWYVLETWKFMSVARTIYNNFVSGKPTNAVIFTNNSITVLPVIEMWPHVSDFSKLGLKVNVNDFVKKAVYISFVEYPDSGEKITTTSSRLMAGEGHKTSAKNGLIAGIGNILYEFNSNAVGTYNAPKAGGVFYVGNGKDNAHRSNALVVFEDGHVEVQKQGESEDSVVTLGYLLDKLNELKSML